ncbi:hypothetical protein [Bacillus thuringiensis]|uniref:Uncharacterized protein n=2 Tax=Bacillus TaxID=1386 RepID=A0A9X6QTP1_BACUH|nr:hypothetical protein [Bacillus thuringiensis]OUB55079.1 hypothetical protein BK716_08850 [Bacillus thuringiensis serovar higo]
MRKQLEQYYSFVVFNSKYKYRKFFADWDIHNFNFKLFIKYIFSFLIISFLVILTLSVYFTIKTQITLELLPLFVIFLFFVSVMDNFGYFHQNKHLFLLDETKILDSLTVFKQMRILSGITFSALFKSFFIWGVIFLPFILPIIFIKNFEMLFWIKIIPFMILVNVGLSLLITYIQFNVSKIFYSNKKISAMRVFNYFITGIFLFLIPYSIISLVLNDKFVINQIRGISEINVVNIAIEYMRIFLIQDMYYVYIFLIILCIIGLSYLWLYTIKKFDLIEFRNLASNILVKGEGNLFIKSDIPFYTKDVIHMKRAGGWFIEYIIKTTLGLLFFMGMTLPFIYYYLGESPYTSAIAICLILVIPSFQLIGDALRTILSVDAEKNSIHLFINKGYTVWNLVRQKLYIYSFFVLITTSTVGLIVFLLSRSLLLMFLTATISFSFGMLSGLFQLATTGLYPKLNWEHHFEIGGSEKGTRVNNLLSIILIPLYLPLLIATYLSEKLGIYYLSELYLILLIPVILALYILAQFLTIKFLKNKYIKDVFIK